MLWGGGPVPPTPTGLAQRLCAGFCSTLGGDSGFPATFLSEPNTICN